MGSSLTWTRSRRHSRPYQCVPASLSRVRLLTRTRFAPPRKTRFTASTRSASTFAGGVRHDFSLAVVRTLTDWPVQLIYEYARERYNSEVAEVLKAILLIAEKEVDDMSDVTSRAPLCFVSARSR